MMDATDLRNSTTVPVGRRGWGLRIIYYFNIIIHRPFCPPPLVEWADDATEPLSACVPSAPAGQVCSERAGAFHRINTTAVPYVVK